MKVLKSGKNAGCFVYYFQIGFQCDGYFNTVVETANENSVENLVEEIENQVNRACGKLHRNFYNLCATCHLQFPGHGCIL